MYRPIIGLLAVVLVALPLAWGPGATVTADTSTEIPAGFLPFLGGGEGDPNALTPAAAKTAECSGMVQAGYFSFFGRHSGDPSGRFVPTPIPCETPESALMPWS